MKGRGRLPVLLASMLMLVGIIGWSGFRLEQLAVTTAAGAYDDIASLATDSESLDAAQRTWRAIHIAATVGAGLTAAVSTAVALDAAMATRRSTARRSPRWSLVGTTSSSVVLIAVAAFLGLMIPWDQVSLWNVAVAGQPAGFAPLLGEGTLSFLVGDAEVAASTISWWYRLHVWIVPIAIVACVAAGATVSWRMAASEKG